MTVTSSRRAQSVSFHVVADTTPALSLFENSKSIMQKLYCKTGITFHYAGNGYNNTYFTPLPVQKSTGNRVKYIGTVCVYVGKKCFVLFLFCQASATQLYHMHYSVGIFNL